MNWRDKLDPGIREHFEDLVKDVAREKSAYHDSQKAQLWVALAVLSKKVSDLELKIKQLEKNKKKKKKNSKLRNSLEEL
tara:strand:- start:1514 stop:1750 length:237 start_codon:yes stop_codon:yes gene_type:complete